MSKSNNAKYTFYYLLLLLSLVFLSLSLGMIVFAIIDKNIPGITPFNPNHFNGQLRFAISALIVATPLFYYSSYLINKELKLGNLSKDSGIRRWLSYFILFISSLIALGTLIGLINSFLAGEITSRFILKFITLLVLSLLIFFYYLHDLKRLDFNKNSLFVKIFFYFSLFLILFIFVSSWFFIESPQTARARLQDEEISRKIDNISNSLNFYYSRYDKLPDALQEIEKDSVFNLDPSILINPKTKTEIVYHKLGPKSFELCTSFNLASDSKNNFDQGFAQHHRAGYQCLSTTVYFSKKPLLL